MGLMRVVGGGGGLLCLAAIVSGHDPSSLKSAQADTPPLSESECRTDLHCWGEKNAVAASIYCKDAIVRQAKYDAQWTDAWYESKTSRYGWADKAKGTLIYAGDKVKFQNGFGAWAPMTYRFVFDPETKAVSDVQMSEGRLD